MPVAALKGLAEKHGIGLAKLESWWSQLRGQYGDDFKAVMGSLMKRIRQYHGAKKDALGKK